MAATRKLQAEIERCLKKVAEGVADFDEIWEKLHSSNGNVSKFQDDLKREIKKLQRYRDQIRSWLLSDDIKEKSLLVENRKLIETQMERFKLNEREAKKKMFSKEGLVSQNLDPIQKERDDVLNWLTATIDTLNVQFDHFECEVESLSLKKRLSNYENDRRDELKFRMEKHAYHIKKLETLLRMLDNMSVEVSQIISLQDNVNLYVEFCDHGEFEDNDFLYDDIEGLSEMELFGLDVPSPRTLEASCTTPTHQKPNDFSDDIPVLNISACETDMRKSKPGLRQKVIPTPVAAPRMSVSRISQNLFAQSQQSATPMVMWEVPAECSSTSLPNTSFPTFASVAANSNKLSTQSTENVVEPSVPSSCRRLPALLELCVQPPYRLGRSAIPQGSDTSINEQREVQDKGNMRQDFGGQDTDLVVDSTVDNKSETSTSSSSNQSSLYSPLPALNIPSSSETPMLSPPMMPSIPLGYNNFLVAEQANQSRVDNYERFCNFLPPIPVAIPPYYPQRKEEFLKCSTGEFFDKLSTQVLFFLFYYSPGSEAQLQAARALKKRQWRFHKGLHIWFIRAEQSTELNDTYEKGKFIYFDFTVWDVENSHEEFTFLFKYLEGENLDLLLAFNQAVA